MKRKQTPLLEEQRMWAAWHTKARAAYEAECKKRGVSQIGWRELPLIPLPTKGKTNEAR
jgi:hypothetical protein